MLASTAFSAGQVIGALLLLTIIGFATRDVLRRRRDDSSPS